MLNYQAVSSDLIKLLNELFTFHELDSFRLVGGTSLALQIGHRKSLDLDLFTDKIFDKQALLQFLADTFTEFKVNWENRNGFTCFIREIKVDFFNWHIPFLFSPIIENDLRVADKREIAAMKLEAITGRKEKKDFIDIAFLLKEYPLRELLTVFKIRYPFITHTFVLESLMAVDYADDSIVPDMLIETDWEDTKKFIVQSVNNYFFEQKQIIENEKLERIRKAEELLKQKKDKDSC
jgi:hypothetical protein